MTDRPKFRLGAAIAILAATAATLPCIGCRPAPPQTTTLLGAVLEAATDPRWQTPLANADITLTGQAAYTATKSDAAGRFRLTLSPAVKPGSAVTLKVWHPGYRPWQMTGPIEDRIYIARLAPVHVERTVEAVAGATTIGDLRVRYSVKTSATMTVGSFARTFEISGSGGVPCTPQAPCSPDGVWKAAPRSVSYDAGVGDEFRQVRVSCIAGPCPFTLIERTNFVDPGRTMKVSVLNWSDTATFLVEADVTRTQINDLVRHSIPFIFGRAMNFTLPASAEGPSIEADVNGSDIVFPLGPALFLSWAACTLQTDTDVSNLNGSKLNDSKLNDSNLNGSKLYHCELKPGYRFR